jgi:hypothetical protein
VKAIEHIRRRFQQQMADKFTNVVEQATGRNVRVFLSGGNIDHDVSVEMLFLADDSIGHSCGSVDDQRLD